MAARDDVVAFYGEHQAGIATPAQDRLALAAFDVTDGARRSDLIALLRDWTAAAAAMTAGRPVPGSSAVPAAPPADTGEAAGLPPASLTLTAGFGPGLFDRRFGLASRRPAALAPLPALPGDELDPNRSGGDLAVQACADDPQVAFHAARNLARVGRGIVTMRWFQLGFGRTSSTSTAQSTPRNLMGFKDGTRNIKGEDTAALEAHVWVGRESEQAWLRGGSYLVVRRIRMLIESWDRGTLADQRGGLRPDEGRWARRSPGSGVRRPRTFARCAAASRSSPTTRMCGSRPRKTMADCGSCAAGTATPTASTRRPVSSTRAWSSWPTRKTRGLSSSRSSAALAAPTPSTNTSGTPAVPCSPARPGVTAAGDWWGRALFT